MPRPSVIKNPDDERSERDYWCRLRPSQHETGDIPTVTASPRLHKILAPAGRRHDSPSSRRRTDKRTSSGRAFAAGLME